MQREGLQEGHQGTLHCQAAGHRHLRARQGPGRPGEGPQGPQDPRAGAHRPEGDPGNAGQGDRAAGGGSEAGARRRHGSDHCGGQQPATFFFKVVDIFVALVRWRSTASAPAPTQVRAENRARSRGGGGRGDRQGQVLQVGQNASCTVNIQSW